MLLDSKTCKPTVKIFDGRGKQIGFVQRYDTVTKEISMYVPAGALLGDIKTVCALENGEVIPKLVTFVLEGSWAEDENGKIS